MRNKECGAMVDSTMARVGLLRICIRRVACDNPPVALKLATLLLAKPALFARDGAFGPRWPSPCREAQQDGLSFSQDEASPRVACSEACFERSWRPPPSSAFRFPVRREVFSWLF
jgi:hypothetical protein